MKRDISQIQTRSGKKYNYSQMQQLHRYYKTSQTAKQNINSALSTDPCMSSVESINDDVAHDLLKQVTLKNTILTAQLTQYKILVNNLQNKITQLINQNQCLTRQLGRPDRNQFMQKDSQLTKYQLKRQKEKEKEHQNSINSNNFSLAQVKEIINQYSQNNLKINCLNKQFIANELKTMIEEKREMELFVESVWKMKDKIDPGNQELLCELWEWLKVVGANYYELITYQSRKGGNYFKCIKQSIA